MFMIIHHVVEFWYFIIDNPPKIITDFGHFHLILA